MAEIDPNKIRLVQITEERDHNEPVAKIVTFRYEDRGDSLTASFFAGEHQVRDEALVSVARDWLHKTCKDIARATEGWAMDDAQLKTTEHPYKHADHSYTR